MLKRVFDISAAMLAGIILLPLMATIALLIYCSIGPPVIFTQQRPGRNGRPFTLYKFRTMSDHCDDTGELLADELRLSRFGNLLRSTSLDELPELWNIIKGDMSLVGPRPLLMEYLELYSPEQQRRHEVRPGLTGWAQVNGRNGLDWPERFRLDVYYVDNQSLPFDLKILLLTIKNVIFRQGIVQEGQATMTKFSGNEE